MLLFRFSVMSDSLWLHGQQHARLPCPSPSHVFRQMYIYIHMNICVLDWPKHLFRLFHKMCCKARTNFLAYPCMYPIYIYIHTYIHTHTCIWTSLVTQPVKNLLAMQKTWVWSLGWEDSLEEGMVTHSSILDWRIPTVRGAWKTTVHGVAKSRTHLSAKAECVYTHTHTHTQIWIEQYIYRLLWWLNQ